MQPLFQPVLHPGVPPGRVWLWPKIANGFRPAQIRSDQIIYLEVAGIAWPDSIFGEYLSAGLGGNIPDRYLSFRIAANLRQGNGAGFARRDP